MFPLTGQLIEIKGKKDSYAVGGGHSSPVTYDCLFKYLANFNEILSFSLVKVPNKMQVKVYKDIQIMLKRR